MKYNARFKEEIIKKKLTQQTTVWVFNSVAYTHPAILTIHFFQLIAV